MPYMPDYQGRLYCPTCGEKANPKSLSSLFESSPYEKYECPNGHTWEHSSMGYYTIDSAKKSWSIYKALKGFFD